MKPLFNLDKAKVNKILAEAKKRAARATVDVLEGSFPQQSAFITDPSRRKAALCTRRAGKTNAAVLMMIYELTRNPNFNCMYIGLTRDTCREILKVVKKFNKKFNLGCRFFKTYKDAVVFPNGSTISLFGMDKEKEMEKILGQGENLKLVVIDECASYSISLKDLIEKHISPMLIDNKGTLVMIGTPGNNRNHFCDITEPEGDEPIRVPGWSVHRWKGTDNPYVAEEYQKEVDGLLALYGPDHIHDPGFQQMYLGKWTIDHNAKAYKAGPKNYIQELPPGNYKYHLSQDLGWSDENSFIVRATKDNDPLIYFVESFSKSEMYLDDIIQQIEILERKYVNGNRFEQYVIDSANKQYVEELRKRSRRPFIAAAKTEKINYVHMMNSDFLLNKIKILEPNCQSLIKEYNKLTIITKPNGKQEISAGDHNADAALYSWRQAYNYNAQPLDTKVKTETDKMNDYWDREAQKLFQREEELQEKNFFERDWED